MSLRLLSAGPVLALALLAAGCACCGHHCHTGCPPATVSSAPPCCGAAPAPCCGGATLPAASVPVPAVSNAPPYEARFYR